MARKIEYGRMLHGGDYNPEQWLDRPDILKKDIEYFKKAHINTVCRNLFLGSTGTGRRKVQSGLAGRDY